MMKRVEQLLSDRESQYPQRLLDARDVLLNMEPTGTVYTRLSEVLFWLGEYAADKEEKENYHSQGVDFGNKAVAFDADHAAAHLWYAANMGSHGLVRGIMSSLFYLKPIQNHGQKAVELDETYFFGAPLRLMGRFYHQCPAWPIGPGNLKRAIAYLERAVSIGEPFLLNKLYLAEALLDRRKRLQARDLLRDIVSVRDPQPFPVYQAMIQKMAQELRDKTG